MHLQTANGKSNNISPIQSEEQSDLDMHSLLRLSQYLDIFICKEYVHKSIRHICSFKTTHSEQLYPAAKRRRTDVVLTSMYINVATT